MSFAAQPPERRMRSLLTSRELRFPGGRARGPRHLLPQPHCCSRRRLARRDATSGVVTRKVCARHSNRGRRGVCGAERRGRGSGGDPAGHRAGTGRRAGRGRAASALPPGWAWPGRAAWRPWPLLRAAGNGSPEALREPPDGGGLACAPRPRARGRRPKRS